MALAAQQLAHIEALLTPSLLPDFSAIHGEFDSDDHSIRLEDITPLLELPSSDEPDLSGESLFFKQGRATMTEELKDLLERNRGKILQINYIVRKLYGLVPDQYLEEMTQATKKLLEEGAREKKWYAMPDSPECWTIDLKEFPDLWHSSKNLSQPKKSAHVAQSARLPYSAKLAAYGTTTAAIRACLQEHHPHSMTTPQVLDWLYPDGIAEKHKKKRQKPLIMSCPKVLA